MLGEINTIFLSIFVQPIYLSLLIIIEVLYASIAKHKRFNSINNKKFIEICYLFKSKLNLKQYYRIRRCLVPLKRPTFYQIHEEGTRQRWFLCIKIFQNFTTFLSKVQLEGCFIITASYLNRKNKRKKRRFSSKLVLRHIFFSKKFLLKIFSKTEILPNSHGGLDNVEYGNLSCFKIKIL